MTASFQSILTRIIQERGIAILENAAKFNGLLQDYTQGQFKKESRLLLQALEIGAYKELSQSEDPDFSKQKLIRKLQDEYGTAKEAAEEIITNLVSVLGDREKTDEEKTVEQISRLEKAAKEGGFQAQYELGLLYEKLNDYKESSYWFKELARLWVDLHSVKQDETEPAPAVRQDEEQTVIPLEKDIEYDNDVWVCGRCGTSNEIFLSNCRGCGKEFNG
jgi:rubrerythrin